MVKSLGHSFLYSIGASSLTISLRKDKIINGVLSSLFLMMLLMGQNKPLESR